MSMKVAAANGLTKTEAKYLPSIDSFLIEINALRKDIARQRLEGRKVTLRIDRNLKEIQTAIDRVEATF